MYGENNRGFEGDKEISVNHSLIKWFELQKWGTRFAALQGDYRIAIRANGESSVQLIEAQIQLLSRSFDGGEGGAIYI